MTPETPNPADYDLVIKILAHGWRQPIPPYDPAALQQYIQIQQYKLLNAINNKLTFFVVLAILAVIVSFFSGMLGSLLRF
jgi:hypothetical protein